MQFLKFGKILGLCAMLLCILQSCSSTAKKSSGDINEEYIVIDKSFTSEKLNHKVLICQNFQKSDLNKKNLKEYIIANSKPTNHKRNMIMLGDYHQYPDAWFYTQIINVDDFAHNLVIDEDNHIRCDGLEVITFKGDSLKNWGSLVRYTPFSERPITFYTFAVPISIKPKDTLNVLMHTQRFYGIHEVNLSIATKRVFLEKIQYPFLFQLSQVVITALCMLVMYIIGWIFSDKTMLYLGIYLTAGFLTLLSFPGFIDTFIIHPNIGLTKSGLVIFAGVLLNVFYHPYGMELMKPVRKNEKFFKVFSYTLMAVNIIIALLFFLPLDLFHKIDIYLPPAMGFLGILSVIWVFYSALLAYFRANIKYFILAACIAFLPFLYEQFTNVFFDAESPLTLKINQSSFILAVIGVSIVSIFQMRDKLVSRKKYEENLTQLKETMEDIRKSEVETIGRNLHDQVGNTLASALGYLNMKNPMFEITQNLIIDSIKEIRFLSHNLVKNEDLPITTKLESLVSRFNDFSSINFQYNDFTNRKLDNIQALKQQNIYMIIQEILTNIIKHSKAKEAYIQIFENNKIIRINIEDDGIGFDNYEINTTGIGLNNINKRAKLSDLKLTIDSTNQGTSIIIEVKNEDKDNNYR